MPQIDQPNSSCLASRRDFLRRATAWAVICGAGHSRWPLAAAETPAIPEPVLTFPGPWQFWLPKSSIILVSDQQLDDLQDPDRLVDLSLSGTPQMTSLRALCEQSRARGVRTVILAFDEFWSQYRAGQGGKPRQWTPDMEEYLERVAKLSQTLRAFDLGFELSLLSPLEIGRGFGRQAGESGRWVQYREGHRDHATGRYSVSLWEQRRWTNNKGTIELARSGIRVFAFRERRLRRTSFYAVDPADIVELATPDEFEVDESSPATARLRRLTIRGHGDTHVGPRDRVLVVVSYATPELDYFSPRAQPFLEDLVRRYHAAGVPLNGLYADEMHIQQDWGYSEHHDEGQFTLRYLTPHLQRRYAEAYGAQFNDFEKYLVYFAYGQHGFYPNLEARLPAQHVLGQGEEDIQQTFLLRRRYYELLERGVVDLFVQAKDFAESTYGHPLEARAHATWAQSPTIDFWRAGNLPHPPRQYEYTPDFLWSNTIHQAASACSDYFAWNDFLTGGGNDHAEGGWSDRNYYALALACSTGVLNRVPYAYAAAWGMPAAAGRRRQALCDAYGASANPWFQIVQDAQHRDTEVLMLYPASLVACEERFGSWMVQYGYANYVTAAKLLALGRVAADGHIELAGRRFGTLAVLFEPLPPAALLPFLEQFAAAGGTLIWAGPPPRLDFAGQSVLTRWQRLFGVKAPRFQLEGQGMAGRQVRFQGTLRHVPPQAILTDFLVDLTYPVEPDTGAETVAQIGDQVVGVHRRLEHGGTTTFLGFRPRDDQSASLGEETRTWFEILTALGAYPPTRADLPANDNPSVVSRSGPVLACRFPNGTTALAVHYRSHVESWPGGFHRDAKQDEALLAQHPLPPDQLKLEALRVNGHRLDYTGTLAVAFRLDARQRLAAFAGYDCQQISVDGREHRFASAPMGLLAWAPVLPERRVPGGAVLELWAHGAAELTIPLPPGVSRGRLGFAGGRPGSIGDTVPATIEDETLRFTTRAEWPQRQLYLVGP